MKFKVEKSLKEPTKEVEKFHLKWIFNITLEIPRETKKKTFYCGRFLQFNFGCELFVVLDKTILSFWNSKIQCQTKIINPSVQKQGVSLSQKYWIVNYNKMFNRLGC